MLDALFLARTQFAANATFHYLFPAITIAMGWCLLFFKIMHNKTNNDQWSLLYKLWVKIFALTFAIGVVTGITMSFQFGTNWPGFMEKVGDVAGPLLAYEVLTAFFLEATFLGIMLFGANRVPNWVHTLATFFVALGTMFSAFWILSLNSWMQTPAGVEWIDGYARVINWKEVVWSPSMPYRFAHILLASMLTAVFFIAGISAYQMLKNENTYAKLGLKFGIYTALIVAPLQILIGDLHGLNTFKYQPEKLAAMEGIWETEQGADLRLFAIVDSENKKNSFEIKLPKMASLILTHSMNGEIKGVNSFENVPPVAPVFYAFRVMLAVGTLMLIAAVLGFIYIRKNTIPTYFLKLMVVLTFSGWIATTAGWWVTEIGRQPYLVYGLLTTAEAAAKTVTSPMIFTSLSMYILLYVVLLVAYLSVVYYIARPKTKN